MSSLSKQALRVDNNSSFPNNTTNYITPAILRAYNENIIDSMVDEIPFGAYTQSVEISLSALNAATSSYVTSAITASSLITASFSGNTLTFRKGDNTTFGVVIPDVSGSGVPTGTVSSSAQIVELGFLQTSSFNAYTSSNDSKVNSLIAATSSYITESETGSFVTAINNNPLTPLTLVYDTAGSSTNVTLDLPANIVSSSSQITALGFVSSSVTASSLVTASFSGNTLTFTKGDASTFGVVIPDVSGSTINTGSFATTGSNTFTGKQIIDGDQNGMALTGSSSYIDLVGNDSHIGLYAGTGSIRFFTGSATGTGTSDIGTWVNMQVNPGNGALAISQFPNNNHFVDFDVATTSSIFTAPLKLADTTTFANQTTILNKSGSLVFISNGQNSTVSHLTSIIGQTNFIFKANNNTGDTIISGSNNIFSNQATPTAGFRKYVTNGNIGLSGTALPQFSSSMAFSPTVSSNLFVNQTNNPMTVRGPVSSSTYNYTNNALIGGQVNLGTAAATNYERAINGSTLANNVINGTINVTAYKTAFTNTSAMAIQTSIIGGTANLNADSSSITLAGSTVLNSALTINNSYYNASATGGGNAFQIAQGNAIFGNATLLYASGSNTTAGTARQFNSNIVAGTLNSASLNLNGDNSNIFATAIIGHNLSVIGTSGLTTGTAARNNTYGSAFFGRHNAQDGTKALTAETVFAIGTGTSTTPKTGFLIDSGSNTFVEGTLNVSGSTSLTGSLTIQSGSSFFANGNKQFNVGAFQSNVTQSGSANVSQSMNFETTDISSGVSIASNSRITLANSGTYNIQFSAQIDRVSGSGTDTVHIWLIKNGTNVSASAGAVTISGGAAAAKTIASWNYVVDVAANDYYELVWEATDSNIQLINQAAGGNIPSTPSIILTVTQVR
jgi:hypothetical protein